MSARKSGGGKKPRTPKHPPCAIVLKFRMTMAKEPFVRIVPQLKRRN